MRRRWRRYASVRFATVSWGETESVVGDGSNALFGSLVVETDWILTGCRGVDVAGRRDSWVDGFEDREACVNNHLPKNFIGDELARLLDLATSAMARDLFCFGLVSTAPHRTDDYDRDYDRDYDTRVVLLGHPTCRINACGFLVRDCASGRNPNHQRSRPTMATKMATARKMRTMSQTTMKTTMKTTTSQTMLTPTWLCPPSRRTTKKLN